MKPALLFYCQHVLGMGHLVRSMELVKGLMREFSVTFISGGEMVEGLPLPSGARLVELPAISTEADFGSFRMAVSGMTEAELLDERARTIVAAFDECAPAVVLIELFPFGRRRFAPELMPLLERAKAAGDVLVVSSVRDILVQRQDRDRFEEKVCRTVNAYFDLILVHSDPALHRFEDSFSRAGDLRCPIEYTGYVAQRQLSSSVTPAASGEKLVVASIGGGRVGSEILGCAIAASSRIQHAQPHRMVAFAGPYMVEGTFAELRAQAAPYPHVEVQRFTPDLCGYLRQADLSISMAGYNTCMNVLATGVRAIVSPFTGNGDSEQTERARKLEALGLLRVIEGGALNAELLGSMMVDELEGASRPATKHQVDMRGVENSVEALVRRSAGAVYDRASLREFGERHAVIDRTYSGGTPTVKSLAQAFQQAGRAGRQVEVFFRDDDIDVYESSLIALLDLFESRNVPIDLAVIPGTLENDTVRLIESRSAGLVHVHQHGFRHRNHEREGRKCEFGPSRAIDEQREDIRAGRKRLLDAFGTRLEPVFTPPWNRCTEATLRVLAGEGFEVLSRDATATPLATHGLVEVPVTLDLHDWKAGGALRPAAEIVDELAMQIGQGRRIGIMLHHKVMTPDAFALVGELLNAVGSNGGCLYAQTVAD